MKWQSLALLGALIFPVSGSAQIVNGDFSEDGLIGWQVEQPQQSAPGVLGSAEPTHGWIINEIDHMAVFLVSATLTPAETGCIWQEFSCGEEGAEGMCEIKFDYRLLYDSGLETAARVLVLIDGAKLFSSGDTQDDLEFDTISFPIPPGDHLIKLCLEVDTGISAWRVNFDNVSATYMENVATEAATWSSIKRIHR
ncbi:MAG: hypothetical protein HKN21_15040 [Candidatus Eisenbacteria bacterium]|uniref:Carbohydrate binding module xylan-binding domain-containing protein n=1 Tax=Eiseniibacteriota bacterium TaxID=2212470 RepID=A0A7Y2H3Q4_UNCEI|nr:hypothetical protein [Candidatus Eisenbacteria bacterium]